MNFTHWRYFVLIEKDLEKTSRYIEICEDNYSTYSNQIAHSLMASASEFDVLAKSICEKLNPTGTHGSINQYFETINAFAPDVLGTEISLPRFGISFSPLGDWKKGEPPGWWTAYNKVKHHRDTEFKMANLCNLLGSIGSLLIICAKFYHLEKAAEIGSDIAVSSALSDLDGSVGLVQLPSNWYYEW
ncbi:hypothetical protein [Methylomonas rivi]|uniref:Uncharacterized protein n=1 Tax=Methylomonas rivi TaxID=2952226 RepID=A0ABT1U6A5_9GAMM|nr:hypothetical protein [Methylomonas sp. WSC-6]MCQ8129390.1 hypothetical protein [Methylomonas sp. WSC-6]